MSGSAFNSPDLSRSNGSLVNKHIQGTNDRRRPGFDSREDTPRGSNEHLSSLADPERQCHQDGQSEGNAILAKVSIRDRIGCYTWTWFTMSMATGGIANVLSTIPYQSDWLHILGAIVLLFNIVLFLTNCVLITLRFRWNPGSFIGSFTSPSESLFIPCCAISVGTILTNMCQYGIPYTGEWFQNVMQVCFWIYISLSFVTSAGMYLILWSTLEFPIGNMTPIWTFPAYPMLLAAPFAANLINAVPDLDAANRIHSQAIALAAICVQGTGFLVSLMVYSAFLYRLMTHKLPREKARPGMFVSVGPSGFTVAGIVTLGHSAIPKLFPSGMDGHTDAAFILKLMADMVGVWLFGLCLWFFVVSVGAHWQIITNGHSDSDHRIHFDMTWYSFVFPNTALTTAIISIGISFESSTIKIIGTVFGGLVSMVWIGVFLAMLHALWNRTLLWPGQMTGAEAMKKRWSEGVDNGPASHKFRRGLRKVFSPIGRRMSS